MRLKIGAALTNTATATLNMDGIGDTVIKTDIGEELGGGELVAGCYTDFLYDGTNWIFLYSREFFQELINGGGGVIIGTQVFTTIGIAIYVPTPGTECCIIECVGGGGGAGGAQAAIATEYMVGGGGGSGAYTRVVKTAADIGASQSVTVGGGGLGGTGNLAIPQNNGGNGDATSLGALCIANGGGGGLGASAAQYPLGGTGGTAGTPAAGEIHSQGAAGQSGSYNNNTNAGFIVYGTGAGAPSVLGGGSLAFLGSTATHGTTAGNYGGGGSGGSIHGQVTLGWTNGGAGSPGIVIVTEFAGRGHRVMMAPLGQSGQQGRAERAPAMCCVPAFQRWDRSHNGSIVRTFRALTLPVSLLSRRSLPGPSLPALIRLTPQTWIF